MAKSMSKKSKGYTKKSVESETANQQLKAQEQQLKAANQQLRGSEEDLKQTNRNLGERVKELNCLYGLSQLAERDDIALEEIFHGLAELILLGWQYPEITAARITFEGHRFKTSNFRKTTWIQSADIKVHGQKAGIIEVCYLKKRQVIDEGPFLKEERSLLNALAERMGSIIERKQTEETLEAANQQLNASNQQLDASNQQLRASEQQLRAANQQLAADEEELRKTHDELREAHDELREAHDELEERVKERTANLADTNKKLRSEINKRKRVEKKIVEYQERLRSLTSQLSITEEQTRKHIAEAIHDDAIQTLIFLKMKFDDLRGLESSNQFSKVLGKIENQTDDLIQRMRTLTFDLSSPMLYDLGLSAAIKDWLNREIEGRYNIKTRFEDDGRAKGLDEDLRVVLYRSVRELLANVVKHAQAKNVTVSRKKLRNKIVITVEDDGKSFTMPKDGLKYDTSGGFGLFTISERLSQYNGSLKIGRGKTGGTRVVLTAPLREQENGDIRG